MKVRFLFLFVILGITSCKKEKSFEFKIVKGNGIALSQPISMHLDELKAQGLKIDTTLNLIVQLKNSEKSLPFQIDQDKEQLYFITENAEHVTYLFSNTESRNYEGQTLEQVQQNGDLDLKLNGNTAISYRYEMTYPPEGVDSLYKKSGFIHPIITPKGDTLTRIQAPDHYHHYGLWGPWTHTQIDGERVDFWNLREGMGTVLFKDFKESMSGDIFTSFTASQEHIDLKTQQKPQVALNEDLTIKMWQLNRSDRYMFDYITNFSSPLKNGILFEAYRYGGGIGLRFHERFKADNCTVLTSEGKDRATADGTNARWCIVTGESSDGEGTSGILFLSHPENRKHPEPMRIWPLDANGGRGDMFFEFCPIRHEEWKIEPAKNYGLKYRMIVFDGELNAVEAEAYWQHFATMPEIKVTKN